MTTSWYATSHRDGDVVALLDEHVLPTGEVGHQQRDEVRERVGSVQRLQGRERRRESRDVELEEPLGPLDVLQPVLTKVVQLDAVDRQVLDDPRGRVREQDLTSVTGCADARGAVHADADVTLVRHERLRGMDAHAHAQRSVDALVRVERPLRGDCGGNGVSGSVESDEEPVPSSVDLVSIVLCQGCADCAVMRRPGVAEVGSESPDEIG